MVPIFERGKGGGIGYSFETFTKKFIDICNDHLETGRARSFAFLLYDFHDEQIREILDNHSFTKIDRLSGKDLSIFYIDSTNHHLIERFNELFIYIFAIDPDRKLPFVLFFKVEEGEIKDLEVVELEQDHLMFAFSELNEVIANYIGRIDSNPVQKHTTWKKYFDQMKKIGVNQFIKHLINKGLNEF